MNFRVKPISSDIAAEVRRTLISPQYRSLAANISIANGYGPCRSCLRVFDQGKDRRIYFTYNSFEGLSSLPDPGPVFIHENGCEQFGGVGFPPDVLDLPIFFEAFAGESRMVSRMRMSKAVAADQVSTLFKDPEVIFINLRNAEAGCYIARVERE